MAEEGGIVHICSRKEQNVKEAVEKLQNKGYKVHGHVCNVGKSKERMAMLEKIGERLDVLVPNAACSTHFGNQLEISEKAYDKLWDLNVKSTFFLIKESLPKLKRSKAANVLVVSSVTGKNPNFTIGVYAMTKAALDNMVKGLSEELMSESIRVNGIAPGLIRTDFSGPLWNSDVPKKSIGEAHQIGSVAACICSAHDGGFMNGEVYQVNGGFAKI